MARKKAEKKKRKREEEEDGENDEEEAGDPKARWFSQILPETKKSIIAIVFFVMAAIFVLSYIGKGGAAGRFILWMFSILIGSGYFFVPILLIVGAFLLLASDKRRIVATTIGGGFLFLLGILAGFNIIFGSRRGGLVGAAISAPLLRYFDLWASVVIVVGLLSASLLLFLNIPIRLGRVRSQSGENVEAGATTEGQTKNNAADSGDDENSVSAATLLVPPPDSEDEKGAATEVARPAKPDDTLIPLRRLARSFAYKKPPLELLHGDSGTPSSGDIRANMNVIKRTFENFNIPVDMDEVTVGPTVTQYTLKPAEGVKLSKITGLHNNLALALAAHPIRIEAPIPGKSLVGIEVPNKSVSTVGLRSLIAEKSFQESAAPLLLALGRDVTGAPFFADLAKMPHLLISGATGAGKSVAIHAIMSALLYRNPPQLLRFIVVDPKRVELSAYNDIPHLLTPVITDPKKTIKTLRWATKEMDRRYELLSTARARDITSYNVFVANSGAQDKDPLPYIIVVIDELADLMATFPREVEAAIVRLAQMARAVGIHLIVATQRPSVEVITGLIKANITTRMAFQVASQVDSRTILDMAGAEKLLGNGDVLFLAGDATRPRRLQGAFVSEAEVKRVVEFLREEAEMVQDYTEDILGSENVEESGVADGDDDESGADDPLYDDAQKVIRVEQKASASLLQRKLSIGYARAARLLDRMEDRGVIGPGKGAKAREVLIGRIDQSLGEEVDVREI